MQLLVAKETKLDTDSVTEVPKFILSSFFFLKHHIKAIRPVVLHKLYRCRGKNNGFALVMKR